MSTTKQSVKNVNIARLFLSWISLILVSFATNAFAGQINLAWNASTGPVSGYRVYYGTASGSYTANVDVANQTTATVANLKDGATYYFAVKSYDSAGNQSGFSNEVSQTLAASGTSSTSTSSVTAPAAIFTATPTSGVAPLLVTLTDTSTGTVTERIWDFGDGTTSTGQSAMKTYGKAGTYTAKLTVKNANGTSTTSKTISVTVTAPVASFTATPTSGVAPLTVQVADTSTNATGWLWNFGDGTTSNLQVPPTHVYKTAGTYTVSLTATGPGGTSSPKIMTITAKAATTATLPNPWQSKDIGSVGVAGSTSYSNGIYTIKGAGQDLWYSKDAFHFAYQPLNGDGSMVVRLSSLSTADRYVKAGIMIRENLDANARYAMIRFSTNKSVVLQYRNTTSGATVASAETAGLYPMPVWLKLARAGNTFTAYSSLDGKTWKTISSTTISMGSTAYVGLALSGHNTSTLVSATFDNVQVQ